MNTQTETKHTPGPWEWDAKPWAFDKEQEAPWLWGGNGLNRRVLQGAEINCSEANAKLIAAAPELLEALRSMVEMLDGGLLAYNTSPGEVQERGLGIARAAIAKATEGAQ